MALFWREDGTRTLSTSERREGGIRAHVLRAYMCQASCIS